jgi:hypothetical protein
VPPWQTPTLMYSSFIRQTAGALGDVRHNGTPYLFNKQVVVYHTTQMPPKSRIDPDFWERFRQTLLEYISKARLNQPELAPKLGLEFSTLNNFLNRHSGRLDGHAVALACTLMTVNCGDAAIGRISDPQASPEPASSMQLVLEFDNAFQVSAGEVNTILTLRKPPGREDAVRLLIRKIG